MPTQSEVEFLKLKHQKFTLNKLQWSIAIGLATHPILAPFELLKVRAQLLQEGRLSNGWSVNRGQPTMRMFYEIIDSGAGIRGLFRGLDTIIARTIVTSASRTFFWCNIYNKINDDPRSNSTYNNI
jgi:hypothetical protein